MNNGSVLAKMLATSFSTLETPTTSNMLSNRSNYFSLSMTAINAVLAFMTISLNLLIILTFVKKAFLRDTPSNVLLLGLASSDFGVGILSQPLFCFHQSAIIMGNINLKKMATRSFYLSSIALSIASFLSLTAIIVDRFLAVHLHLRYQELVTTKRYGITLAGILITSILLSASRHMTVDNKGATLVLFTCITIVVLIVLVNVYFIFKISQVIRRHSAHIEAQQQVIQQPLDIPRYKKSVTTVYFLIGGFVWSYLLLIGVLVTYAANKNRLLQEFKDKYLFPVTEVVMMFNGILNPLIYCVRVKEIRRASLLLLRKIFHRQSIPAHPNT